MPRNAPSVVRARLEPSRWSKQRFSRIDGLSRYSHEALARLEAQVLGPGRVAAALAAYTRWLAMPGRWRYVSQDVDYPDEVLPARDMLQEALDRLPPVGRAELRRLVAPLDAEFWRRTMPEPNDIAPSYVPATRWWHQRLES